MTKRKTTRSAPGAQLAAPTHWLGEALTHCAQYLLEQGACELLALQGRAVLYTDVRLDLAPGRWLLVRFPAPAAEADPHFLALVMPPEDRPAKETHHDRL